MVDILVALALQTSRLHGCFRKAASPAWPCGVLEAPEGLAHCDSSSSVPQRKIFLRPRNSHICKMKERGLRNARSGFAAASTLADQAGIVVRPSNKSSIINCTHEFIESFKMLLNIVKLTTFTTDNVNTLTSPLQVSQSADKPGVASIQTSFSEWSQVGFNKRGP